MRDSFPIKLVKEQKKEESILLKWSDSVSEILSVAWLDRGEYGSKLEHLLYRTMRVEAERVHGGCKTPLTCY